MGLDFLRTTAIPIYIDLYKSERRVRIGVETDPETGTLSKDELRKIDPLHINLTEHSGLPSEILLAQTLDLIDSNNRPSGERMRY